MKKHDKAVVREYIKFNKESLAAEQRFLMTCYHCFCKGRDITNTRLIDSIRVIEGILELKQRKTESSYYGPLHDSAKNCLHNGARIADPAAGNYASKEGQIWVLNMSAMAAASEMVEEFVQMTKDDKAAE